MNEAKKGVTAFAIGIYTGIVALLATLIQSFVATFSDGLGVFWSAVLTPLSLGTVVVLGLLVVYLLFTKKA
jgi:hypothetical protein